MHAKYSSEGELEHTTLFNFFIPQRAVKIRKEEIPVGVIGRQKFESIGSGNKRMLKAASRTIGGIIKEDEELERDINAEDDDR